MQISKLTSSDGEAAASRLPFPLDGKALQALVGAALEEDVGKGDLTTQLSVEEDQQARGAFVAQQDLVVAGLPVAVAVFMATDPQCRWERLVEEGARAGAGSSLAVVHGGAASLLAGERVALNFLQHLSGIATLTRRMKDSLSDLSTELLDTRKTLPGLRILEKYAVTVGGGRNHRLRLDDGILIKSNHLRLAGGIRQAVEKARRSRPANLEIEVEVATPAELEQAIAAGAERVLLDNMTPAEVRRCVELGGGRVRLEVSGGIGPDNLRAYAETGVDAVSVGALTHSAPAVQIHFVVEPM